MKLINIYLIQSCNYDCKYCTLKRWLYSVDFVGADGKKANRLTNEKLLRYIDEYHEYFPPNETIIKLTGWEPGLYPDLPPLLNAFFGRGYLKILIETNGSLPIPKLDGVIRLAAWHRDRPKPEYYDAILIIKHPKDNWLHKVNTCLMEGIPFYETELRGSEASSLQSDRIDADLQMEPTMINEMLMIYSSGDLQMCPSGRPMYGNIEDMTEPVFQELLADNCKHCPQTHVIDYFYNNL